MAIQNRKISELPLTGSTASNTVIPISQGSPATTYRISVDDLIRNSSLILGKASQLDLNALSGRVSAVETNKTDNQTFLATVESINSNIADIESQMGHSNTKISEVSGIRYNKFNGQWVEF